MNKSFQAVLFVVAATVINILAMAVIFLLLFIPFSFFLSHHFSPGVNRVIMFFIFIVSIVLTFVLYQYVARIVIKKFKIGGNTRSS